MKNHQKQTDFRVSMLNLLITPTQISFHRTVAQAYFLELCKGPQVYKRFGEEIYVHADQKSYMMTSGQTLDLKINNEKGGLLEWVIYKVTDDEMKQYMTSVPFDLSSSYNNYLSALKNHAKEYSQLIAFQSHSIQLEKQWPLLKDKLPFQEVITATHKQFGIDIVCKVTIQCELDRLAETERKIRLERQLSKNSSKGSYNLGSKTYLQENSSQKQLAIQINRENQGPVVPQNNKESTVPRNEVLSDIVEASNQCSSTKNHEQKNQRMQTAISQIPEEEQNSPTFHPSIRTQNFDRMNLGDLDKRRINTLRQDYTHVEDQEDQFAEAYQSMMKSKIKDQPTESEIKEDPFAASQTAVPSQIQHNSRPQPKSQHIQKKRRMTPIIAFFILIAIGLASLYSLGLNPNTLSRQFITRYLPFISRSISQPKENKSKQVKQQSNKKNKKGVELQEQQVPYKEKKKQKEIKREEMPQPGKESNRKKQRSQSKQRGR